MEGGMAKGLFGQDPKFWAQIAAAPLSIGAGLLFVRDSAAYVAAEVFVLIGCVLLLLAACQQRSDSRLARHKRRKWIAVVSVSTVFMAGWPPLIAYYRPEVHSVASPATPLAPATPIEEPEKGTEKAAKSSETNEADFIATFDHARIDPVGEGRYLAQMYLTLYNPTDVPVENLRTRHQHRTTSGWTGCVGCVRAAETTNAMRLPPRSKTSIFGGSADTVADPATVLRRGDKMYFAYRAVWDNPNFTPGCKVFFVEFWGIPGDDVGKVEITGNVVDSIPRELVEGTPNFAIHPCPKRPRASASQTEDVS
jgi:hypothetical protein